MNNSNRLWIFVSFAFIINSAAVIGAQRTVQHPAEVTVYFSPSGGATDAIVRELNAANTSIQVQAYSFTSTPIAKALTDAHKRGVKLEAVLDKSNNTARYSSATFLKNAGIPVLIDDRHAIAHNKIILIDGETIITGSFNFSKAAEESNVENVLVIKESPGLLEQYQKNFHLHQQHSIGYEKN